MDTFYPPAYSACKSDRERERENVRGNVMLEGAPVSERWLASRVAGGGLLPKYCYTMTSSSDDKPMLRRCEQNFRETWLSVATYLQHCIIERERERERERKRKREIQTRWIDELVGGAFSDYAWWRRFATLYLYFPVSSVCKLFHNDVTQLQKQCSDISHHIVILYNCTEMRYTSIHKIALRHNAWK